MAIYGLKESGKLANEQLQKVLAKRGYYPCAFTQGLYKHESCPISFSLVVDDFGVKYIRKEDADHLEQTIKNSYPMKTDWTGEYYVGMTLKWDYNRIIMTEMYASPCLAMYAMPSSNSNTPTPRTHMPRHCIKRQSMAENNNWSQKLLRPHS